MSKQLPLPGQGDWPEPTKFDQLRIKTEKQLLHLINIELDHGIRNGRLAFQSADAFATADECTRRAKAAHTKAAQLFHFVTELTEDERNRVELRLKHLGAMLGTLPATDSAHGVAENAIAHRLRQRPQQQHAYQCCFGAAGGA